MDLRPAAAPRRAASTTSAFIHSLTARSNTHGPAMLQMNTGFMLDGFPSIGRVGHLRARAREPGPARLRRHPRPARRAAQRPGELEHRLPARRASRAPPSTPQRADRQPRPPAERRRPAEQATPRLPGAAQPRALRRSNPGDSDLAARIAAYELAARMQLSAPEVTDLSTARPPRRLQLYGADDPTRSRPASPATASWPGGCWSAACGSSSSSAAPARRGDGAAQLGRAQDARRTDYERHARSWTSPPRRC